MPYTLAHPAAVLPLRRLCPRWLSWSALVIGATTPDVEYFLKLEPGATWGPTLLGAVTFCLPVGLALFALWHGLLARPLTLLLPAPWRERLWPVVARPLPLGGPFLLRVLVSVLLGAWSHQVWDAFTHGHGWGVRAFPALATTLVRIEDYDLTVCRVIQHGSTFLGAALLARAARRALRDAPRVPAPSLPKRERDVLRLALVAFPLVTSIALALLRAQDRTGVNLVRELASALAIGVVSFGALGATAVALYLRLRGERTRGGADPSGTAPTG